MRDFFYLQLLSKGMHSRYNKTVSRLFIPTILACIGLSLALAMYRIANRTHSHKYAIAAGMPTVAVERTLLASKNTPGDDIRQLTSILYEHRQELDEKMQELAHKDQRLAAAIPLASYIHPPNNLESVSRVPIHPGAQAYYDREKPSFFKANADVLASLLSIVALLGSGVWELKSRLEKNQKNQADKYSERVIKELNDVMTSSSTDSEKLKKQLLDARRNLLDIFKESVIALNENRISQESFQSFRVVWQVAMEAVDREDTLLEKSF